MPRRKTLIALCLISIPLIILMTASLGLSAEVTLPHEVFYFYPVASATGQNAVWINPAALGQRQSGSMLIFAHRDNRIIRDWGTASTTGAMGVGYRFIKGNGQPDYKELTFALGAGQRTAFGLSYQYIKEGPGYLRHRHLWNAGLLLRHSRDVSFGIRAENLNRGRIDGLRSDIRFVYGVAARTYQDRLTVSFDVDLTHKQSHRDALLKTGMEVRPMPGMFVYADIDNHSHFNLGIRINLNANFVGNRTEFDRTGKTYLSTTYAGTVLGKQSSLIKPKRKSLTMGLDGDLPENPDIPFFGRRPLRFIDYIEGIYKAADDNEIDRMFLNIGTLRCGLAKAEELSGALKYFSSKGKPIYVYLSAPDNLGYLVASEADFIIVPPVSQLRLVGLRAELMMYKGLLDKLGVQLELERVDEYKSAAEPYIYDRPTKANVEQTNRWLDRLYDEFVSTIAANRDMTVDSIKKLIDTAPLTSVEAKACGLVDTLLYSDEVRDLLADLTGASSTPVMSLYTYANRSVYDDRWGEKPKIAVLIADGSITRGTSGGKIGDHEMIGAIRKARYDTSIDGVILRINSPGGQVQPSDILWHEIALLAESKPLVISVSNVAASGGYYIAAINNRIFIDRSSITGSIGVFGGKINFAELYDKLGVYTEIIRRGENASMYSTAEPFTEAQRTKLREQLWKFYNHFVDKVAEVRTISADSINALGRGQVWTGAESVENGLSDTLGGFHQALIELTSDIGLSTQDVDIVSLPEKQYFFKNPFSLPFYSAQISAWLRGTNSRLTVFNEIEQGNIFYRMPYDIVIE